MLQEQETPDAREGLFEGKPAWKSYTPSGTTDSRYKAYVPEESVRCQELISSEERVKAQKQKNRISNGFMLEQDGFTDMVAAVAGDKLMLTTDFEYDDTEPRSPVSTLEPPTAFAEQTLNVPAAGVDELHGTASGHATCSDCTPSAPKVSFGEGATAEYKTLRRVRVAKVELRYLARPIPQGESKPLLTTTGYLLDTPIPTNLSAALPSRLLSPKHKEDESSWDWPRFTDREHADPAVEHSRRFREKKVWAKNNSGDLIDFWKEGTATEKQEKEKEEVKKPRPLSVRFSSATSTAFSELLDLWEKR